MLRHSGVSLGNANITYLLYADDLVLLAESADELQSAIFQLQHYASICHLTVNIQKTKCMIFYQGWCPQAEFYYMGRRLETCNEFTYLGVIFTTRLSSSKHIDYIISKCNTRLGILFNKLPLKDIPFSVVMNTFNVYILSVITYALPIWYPQISNDARCKLNSVFTKFLKRHLGLPYSTNNSIVHFLTETQPLSYTLDQKLLKATLNITYPRELNGVVIPLPSEFTDLYSPLPKIPSYFWMSRPIEGNLPIQSEPRRALLYDIIDLIHPHICKTANFHLEPVNETCICRFCLGQALHYHQRECPFLKNLSYCALLKKVFKPKK